MSLTKSATPSLNAPVIRNEKSDSAAGWKPMRKRCTPSLVSVLGVHVPWLSTELIVDTAVPHAVLTDERSKMSFRTGSTEAEQVG